MSKTHCGSDLCDIGDVYSLEDCACCCDRCYNERNSQIEEERRKKMTSTDLSKYEIPKLGFKNINPFDDSHEIATVCDIFGYEIRFHNHIQMYRCEFFIRARYVNQKEIDNSVHWLSRGFVFGKSRAFNEKWGSEFMFKEEANLCAQSHYDSFVLSLFREK